MPSASDSAKRLLVFSAIACSLACAQELAERDPPKNIVLISLDTFRADRLQAYGGTEGLTPHLDRLARSSTVFENASTPIGSTFPAHASMFTGLYPVDHRVRWNGDTLGGEFETVAERFRDGGYTTAAFVGLPPMLKRGGLGRGFDDQYWIWREGASATNSAVADWLANLAEAESMFLWVHYYDTHTPLRSTPHSREKLVGYEGFLEGGASVEQFYSMDGGGTVTEEDWKALGALYDGETVELDTSIGSLLSLLDARQRLESAVVMVVADHGQLLGEHGLVGHGWQLWEPVLRTPFVVWQSADTTPRTIDARVSLIDVAPTLIDLARLEPLPAASGRSLVPALNGAELDERSIFSIVRASKGGQLRLRDRSVSVVLGSKKLIKSSSEELFFDLEADPEELSPVDPEHRFPRVAAELRRLAVERLQQDPREEDQAVLPAEVVEELEALGYLQ